MPAKAIAGRSTHQRGRPVAFAGAIRRGDAWCSAGQAAVCEFGGALAVDGVHCSPGRWFPPRRKQAAASGGDYFQSIELDAMLWTMTIAVPPEILD